MKGNPEEDHSDPGQPSYQDAISRRLSEKQSLHKPARFTSLHIYAGLLVLLLLLISSISSFVMVSNSYASVGQSNGSLASTPTPQCTSKPKPTPSPTSNVPGEFPTQNPGSFSTATPVNQPTPTPTATATKPKPTPTPKPTATPTVAPTPTPIPTPTPTDTPTATPTDTPTPPPAASVSPTPTDTPTPPTPAASVSPTPTDTPPVSSPTATTTQTVFRLSYIVSCSTPVVTPTSGASSASPVPSTPTGGNGGSGTPPPPTTQTNGGGFPRGLAIALVSLMGLLLSLGIGWVVFRRMLLPQAETKLPPSGAVPWSRTRIANPNSLAGTAGAGRGPALAPLNPVLAFSAASAVAGNSYTPPKSGPSSATNDQGRINNPNGYALSPTFNPQVPGHQPSPNGPVSRPVSPNGPMSGPGPNGPISRPVPPNGPISRPGPNAPANGFGGYSENFIPPSPQIFPQGEAIPPGSGVFRAGTNGGGFSPASSAFTAMYGLPEDPAALQANAPEWIENFTNGKSNGNGSGGSNGNSTGAGGSNGNNSGNGNVNRSNSNNGGNGNVNRSNSNNGGNSYGAPQRGGFA